jgi:hypothetical protein
MAYGDIGSSLVDSWSGLSQVHRVHGTVYVGLTAPGASSYLKTFSCSDAGVFTKSYIGSLNLSGVSTAYTIKEIANNVFAVMCSSGNNHAIVTVSISNDGATLSVIDSQTVLAVGESATSHIHQNLVHVSGDVWIFPVLGAWKTGAQWDLGYRLFTVNIATSGVITATPIATKTWVLKANAGNSIGDGHNCYVMNISGTTWGFVYGSVVGGTYPVTLQTFTLSNAGSFGVDLDSHAFAATKASTGCPYHIHGTTWALIYNADSNVATLDTFSISAAGVITDITTTAMTAIYGGGPVAAAHGGAFYIPDTHQVDTNKYLFFWVAYYASTLFGAVTTITISDDGATVSQYDVESNFGISSPGRGNTIHVADDYYMMGINFSGDASFGLATFMVDSNPAVVASDTFGIELAFNQSILTESPTWTDITTDLMSIHIKRGRMHELDRVESGTLVLEVNNASGNYWRNNPASTYYPCFKPVTLCRVWVRKYGIVYYLYYGVVEKINPTWRDTSSGKSPICVIQCADLFKSFSRLSLMPAGGGQTGTYRTGYADNDGKVQIRSTAASGQKTVKVNSLTGIYAGQSITVGDKNRSEVNYVSSLDYATQTITCTNNLVNTYSTGSYAGYVKKFPAGLSGRRVNDVLYELGWPHALTDIDAGQVTVTELIPPAGGTKAMDHLFDVVEAEAGNLFLTGQGHVCFQDQLARQTDALLKTSQATISDDGTDYTEPELSDDDDLIYNEVHVKGDAIGDQMWWDATAQSMQGKRMLTRDNSLLLNASEAITQAYALVERFKDSKLRAASLTIHPDSEAIDLYPYVYGFELGTKITVILDSADNPDAIPSPGLPYHIEGIQHEWNASDNLWTTKWQLWDPNQFRNVSRFHGGYLYNAVQSSYATVHNEASADDVYNGTAILQIGQESYRDSFKWFRIWRGAIEFNTAALAGLNISSAAILFRDKPVALSPVNYIKSSFTLQLVPAIGVGYPMVKADYGDLLNNTTNYGQVTIFDSSYLAGGWNKIELTAAGIAAINTGGVTRFGLRSAKDISATDPSGPTGPYYYSEYLQIYNTDADAPRLIVTVS